MLTAVAAAMQKKAGELSGEGRKEWAARSARPWEPTEGALSAAGGEETVGCFRFEGGV
jgi:hypothetical protein